MNRKTRKATLRCAIYTRVSTENGLEQEFNSLDNQREASEAYVRSQAHEGWKLIRDRYDDGGFSGGSMDRPALARLLDDVRARRVDVIVVYKVDRLTRSLADFAKLVELFDEHDVSFISVTQAFNTTTSMGRLTLNMLLSFAQFEREITGERIRDKVAASKKRGIWMGGAVPFGYRVENRALHIVEEHAEFVRDLFRRYLEVGSVVRLKAALDAENVRLPVRVVGTGRTTGGGLISRGHLYWILSNPIYVGRLRHKGQIHDGLHAAIVDQETWDRVQRRLEQQTQPRADPRPNSESLSPASSTMIGAIGWAQATPPRAASVGATISRGPILQGRKHEAGSRPGAGDGDRAPGNRCGARALARPPSARSAGLHREGDRPRRVNHPRFSLFTRELLDAIERVVSRERQSRSASDGMPREDQNDLTLPWIPPSPHRRREIIQGEGDRPCAISPMRTEARAVLTDALRDAHRWLDELTTSPHLNIESLAAREGKTERSIRRTISLAFLCPALVKAAIDGRLPRGFGVKRLMDLPIAWPDQWSALGLRAPAER